MRNFSKIILGMLTLVLFNACKHNNFSEYVGPSICPSASFRIINHFKVSDSTDIDFTSIPADTMTASFSEPISWTVTIKGLSSGAIKVYQDHSTSINLVWMGEPGANRVFFTTGEAVTISFTAPCVETKVYNTKLTRASDFSLFGTIMTDFDGGGYVPNVTPIHYSGANPSFVGGPLTPPQGNTYLHVYGDPTTTWYAGGVEFGGPTLVKVSNPDSVYFNAYVSSGDNTTTLLGVTLTSGTGKYNKYNLNIPINWTGWRFVSFPISAFKNGASASMVDARKIVYVDFGLNCATQIGQPTEFDMDFVIFTYNKPFFQ